LLLAMDGVVDWRAKADAAKDAASAACL